jgi:hypothetical protein
MSKKQFVQPADLDDFADFAEPTGVLTAAGYETAAQRARRGAHRSRGKLGPKERTEHFLLRVGLSIQESRNGRKLVDVDWKREVFVRIEAVPSYLERLAPGYTLSISHNPKRYLTGVRHLAHYAMCELAEEAVETYNRKNN